MKKNGQAAHFTIWKAHSSARIWCIRRILRQSQSGILPTLKKSISTLVKLPVFGVTDLYSRNVFNEYFFRSYEGESEDRLRYFATELFEDVLKPAIFDGTRDLIKQIKKIRSSANCHHGRADFSVKPLCDYLGIDDFAANRLEFVNGYATGRLLPPVMASATKAKWIREYAEKHEINLSASYAYSDSISDLPMLSIVGHPVAVSPDFRLKQTALQHDWAILDLK